MIEIIHSFFDNDKIIEIDIDKEQPKEYIDNEYVVLVNNQNVVFQQLSSSILLILSKYTADYQDNILVTPENSICVHFGKNASQSYEMHRHNYIEMVYLIDGETDYIIQDQYYRYQKGDICIINQNVRHMEIPTGNFEALYFSLSKEFIQKYLNTEKKRSKGLQLDDFINRNISYTKEMDYLEFHPITENVDRQINEICVHMLQEMIEKKAGYMDFVSGFMKRLIAILQVPEFYQCNNIHYTIKDTEGLFERILAYIHSHPYKVERSELSREMNYNGNYLSEVFLEHTGITMAAYIRNICLQEASRLLLNTELPVSAIIESLHYENRTTFYRLFRKKYGVSPAEYRKNQGIRRT